MIRIIAGNVFLQASAAIAPAITLAVLLRRVGFGEFGQVLACQTLVALFAGVCDMGCSIRGLQRVARQHHTRGLGATRRSVRLFMTFRCTAALAGGAVLLVYLLLFKHGESRLILPTLILYFAQALTPTWVLLALESVARITVQVVAARAVWVALTIGFARQGLTYLWLVAGLNVALYVLTARRVDLDLGNIRMAELMPWRRFRRVFRANIGFSLSRVAVNVYQAAPLLILSHVASSAATGVYATIETVHKVYATASFPITSALFGRTSRTRSAADFVQYGVPLLLAMLLSIAVAAAQAGLVLSIIGGGRAAGAAPQLRLILVATALSVVSIFVGYPLAGGLGHAKAVNRTTFAAPVALLAGFTVAYGLSRDPLFAAIVALICAEGALLVLRVEVVRHAYSVSRAGAIEGEAA